MSEMGDDYRYHRKQQQKRRARRLPPRAMVLDGLNDLGYEVRKLTCYQYRITKSGSGIELDIYPIHLRFHVINNGHRGKIHGEGRIINFVESIFNKKEN